MAEITISVELPEFLERPELLSAVLDDAAETALESEMPNQVTEVVQSEAFPKDRGLMQRSLSWSAPERRDGGVSSRMFFSGQASAYGSVQEQGRRPGARNPPFAAILSWVKRRRADAVNDLARELQSQYATAHPKRRRGVSRSLAKYRESAAHLLARGLIRKMKARGMKGKQFIASRVREMEREIAAVYEREIREALRRRGAGG